MILNYTYFPLIPLLLYITDAKTWEEATLTMDQLYGERASIEEFLVWRDDRVIDEVQWYGCVFLIHYYYLNDILFRYCLIYMARFAHYSDGK